MKAQHGENPILWLALLGFAPDEELKVWSALTAEAATRCWRPSAVSAADACFVHGGRVEPLGDSDFRVRTSPPEHRTLTINLQDMTRPVAFALPVPATLRAPRQFSIETPQTVRRAVSQMRDQLVSLRARFALGHEIVRAGSALRYGAFQLLDPDRNVLAQLDFRAGRAALAQGLTSDDVATAKWVKVSAKDAPVNFAVMTTAQLSWTYAKHSERDLLPSSYRERLIFYRGPPRVPVAWLSDEQLAVLTELTASPQALEDLAARIGCGAEDTVRALTPLYFASAITSTPSKAALPWHRRAGVTVLSTGGELSPGLAPEIVPGAQTATIPGALWRSE